MSEAIRFPVARDARHPLDPPPAFVSMREEGPAHQVRMWDGSLAWMVTRYEDAKAVLLDKRFTADAAAPGYPMFSPARKSLLGNELKRITLLEGDEHLRLRRLIGKEITVKRVEGLRPIVRELINSLIDDMLEKGPPLDFVEHFALKLPSTVICAMMGVPYEDHAIFEDLAKKRVQLDADPSVPVEATEILAQYFDKRMRERQANPTGRGDLLDKLVSEHIPSGAISWERAVQVAYELVQGGHETTANAIALGVLLLLTNPDQKARLLAEPDVVPSAVEEMLRFTAVSHISIARTATEDAEIGEQTIKAGEGVLVNLLAANHDPGSFADPEDFDVLRGARNHVAFSFGIHQCVGQQLARMELQEVFSVLFQRMPHLRLTVPLEALEYKAHNIIYGVETMPISW